MAFNRPSSSNNNQAAGNESWRAAGFLNFSLPTKEEGKTRKLGAITLRLSKESEKTLNDWLKEDPSRVNILLSKLIVTYQSAEASDKSAFDLSIPEEAAAKN